MSCICPHKSTESNVSPCCWERIAVGVVMTATVPAQARPNEARSFKSPSTSLPPRRLSVSFFTESEVDRTMARNGLPADARRRQISVPSKPVAPTTKITVNSKVFKFVRELNRVTSNLQRLLLLRRLVSVNYFCNARGQLGR